MRVDDVLHLAVKANSLLADQRRVREQAARARRLVEGCDQLSPRQRTILRRRFGIDGCRRSTLEELARRFGTTPQRIRVMEAEALRRIGGPGRVTELARSISVAMRHRHPIQRVRRTPRALQHGARHRRASGARPVRGRGSRRATSRSAGGGSSGSDDGEGSEPPPSRRQAEEPNTISIGVRV